jgi:hypothetical protein
MYMLVGAIGEDPASFLLIGSGVTMSPDVTGTFGCFANDWPNKYDNNRGRLRLAVEALEYAKSLAGGPSSRAERHQARNSPLSALLTVRYPIVGQRQGLALRLPDVVES